MNVNLSQEMMDYINAANAKEVEYLKKIALDNKYVEQ